MKVAVLGAGTIVPDFLKAVDTVTGLEAYCIMGMPSDDEKMNLLAQKHNLEKIYHSIDEVLADENVEVVYNALPNHLHYAFTKKAIEAKKNCIVEKPFCSNYVQAKELIDLAKEYGVNVFEAISNQYMPNYKKTKELVQEVGDVKIVQLNYSQYSRRYDQFKAGITLPVFDPKKSGGALMDLNVYNIHYVLGLFGKPASIHYYANIEKGIDTSGVLTMQYPTFQVVSVAAKDCKAPVSINVQGDKGYIHSDMPANVYGSFSYGLNSGEATEYSLNEGKERLYYELQEFSDAIHGNKEVFAIYDQHTLDVQEILDEARRQVGVEVI